MCVVEAITLATLAGGAVSSYGAYQSGKATQQSMNAQAEQANYQAGLDDIRAGEAQVAGAEEAQRRTLMLSQDIGSVYANFAGNGLMLNTTGTVDKSIESMRNSATLDTETILKNAESDAWGFTQNAYQNRKSAKNYKAQGKSAKTVGKWGAAGSLLGSTAQAGAFGHENNAFGMQDWWK